MSRISAESFLSLIQQSGLVESDRLQREVDDLEDQGLDVAEASVLANSLVERDLLTEWQADKLLRGKHKGFTLGKYRLRRLLGKGGMSSVYLAEHILMRRQCAIKVLPIKRVEDTSYLARFHREARAVASLDHPNIVRAYDIDHETEGEKDIHFLVMEHVDGESLHEQVKDHGPLELDETAEFFRQAALGLGNAHKNGLIHRDVKPGNLLIDRSGVVKVLDLGLARFSEVSDDNPLTLAHDEKVLGTADYLAPEQALDSHTADHRADIYGLGCTAYFALTGYPPFREGTLTQRLMFHQTKEPPAISEERPEVGESKRGIALTEIISQMMAKKSDERFQTMDEVATAFARWLKIYATPEWRAAHPDAFLKSDTGSSGGTVPVAKAVAVPVANSIVPEAAAPATKVASGGDTLLQTSAAKPSAAVPVTSEPATIDPNATLIEPPAPATEPVTEVTSPVPVATPVAAKEVAATNPVEPEVSAPAEPPSAQPEHSDLAGWDEGSPDVEPLADFDPSILPAPLDEDSEEYPSLLGGTPTGQRIPGLDDPADATQSAMEQTQDYIPTGKPLADVPADATLLNPVESSSEANHDIVPAISPAATAPAEAFSFEAPPADTPVFEPAQPAAPVAQPGFDTPPQFAEPGQPAFPTDTPTFGAPQAASAQYAAPGQTPSSSTAKKKPPIAIIAGIVIALLAGVGGYFAFTGGGDDKPKSKKTASNSKSSSKGTASKSKTVSGSGGKFLGPLVKVGPGSDFSTINAALDYLKTNKTRYDTGSRRTSCKVEVVGGETYNEAIVVDNSGGAYPPGIQIVSSGVGRAKLTPSGSGPAIKLVGIEFFVIQGFDVDASGKDVAIELSGYLSRSCLKDLNVSGFSKVGIAMKGAVGFNGAEIGLEKIDLRGAGRTTAGIHVTSGENSTSRIKITNCRLFGPQENGLLIESDVTYLEMRENIVANADVGISFRAGPLTLRDVQILNTTFYKCSRGGIILDQMPTPAGGSSGTGGLAISRNLFAQVNGPELLIESDFDDKKFDRFFSTAIGGVEQNWSDRQQSADIAAGQREIVHRDNQRIPAIEFSSTDADSPDFLSLKKNVPYAQILGENMETKPYIGARPAK
jgi:eukaryotic-like serine/threonine-protein kinase